MDRPKKGRALVAAARGVDSQVKAVARRRNADKIELARLLLDMHERRLAEALGYESVAAYAEDAIHQAPSTTRQLLALARRVREQPELAGVAASGELPWTLLRTIAGAATSENLGEWVEKARTVPRAELERPAREARGDVRNGPAAVRRVLPPKVANFVDARDRGRCRVHGCTNRVFLERHHEGPGGWRAVGHSPEHVLTLCTSHHVARHEGRLFIEGDANETLTFRLADGSELPSDRRRASRELGADVPRGADAQTRVFRGKLLGPGVPREAAARAPRKPDPGVFPGASAVALAEAALRKLEFTAVEVRTQLQTALASVGPSASVEALTLAALRASG